METLRLHIEALIFASEQSITLDEIMSSLKVVYGWDLNKDEVLSEIEILKEKYAQNDFSFELVEISQGYQFLTKKDFQPILSVLLHQKSKKRLSTAAMETLAIIAYKQPVTKAEIEYIRGVNCDYSLQKLLEKDLIEIQGKSDKPGKPVLYGTSKTLLDYFGLKSIKDLPQLKDVYIEENQIGQPNA